MFFPKLRRRAKWVFVLLAAAFALGFVFFGVGTGISGANPIDALLGVFEERRAEGGGPSVEDARERVRENPNDPEARLELAQALQAAGNEKEAIAVLERYVELRPRDESALQQLATLHDVTAQEAQARANEAQLEAQQHVFPQTFLQTGQSRLTQALTDVPISQELARVAAERASQAYADVSEAYRRKAEIYRDLTRLNPDDPSYYLELGQAAQFSGDAQGAIRAYTRFLRLAPDDASAPLVREQLRQLERPRGSG